MEKVNRWIFYILGMVVLAAGITLNTKTGLGVSPIISVAYCVSQIFELNFGDMTFVLYGIFVVVQLFLRERRERLPSGRRLVGRICPVTDIGAFFRCASRPWPG